MSRVADQLGTGASFNRARGVSARRQAVAATTGAPTTGAPDSRLRTLPLTQLVPTRFNPRRAFGTDDQLREFGLKLKKKQLQPAVAVTRDAYLQLWPDEADNLGSAQYVIANGERRYRGSRAAGLATLEVVVDDEIASSRADFLDAVLSENNDREDLDPIERALGIETMVEQLGGADKVAEYYGKTKGWVSQQRKLLKLIPDLQTLVAGGDLPIRVARDIAGLPAPEQAGAWTAEQNRRKAAESTPRPPRTRKPATLEPATPEPATPERFTAVNQPAPLVPDQRPNPTPTSTATSTDTDTDEPKRPVVKMPWADGAASMDIIFAKLDPSQRRRAVARYLQLLGSTELFIEDLVAASTPEFRRDLAELLVKEL